MKLVILGAQFSLPTLVSMYVPQNCINWHCRALLIEKITSFNNRLFSSFNSKHRLYNNKNKLRLSYCLNYLM